MTYLEIPSNQSEQDFLIVSMLDIRRRFSNRDPEMVNILQFFANDNLSADLQGITRPFVKLAFDMADSLRYNSELIDGLRLLLRSKDSFVRAAILLRK